MKEIKLTQGFVTLVDDEDFEYLNQWSWYARKGRYTYYAKRSNYKGSPSTISMHRVIMNAPDELLIDHRNGNGLDNQKHNLRTCTNGQNLSNRRSSGKSKYLGVSHHRKGFVASISYDNQKFKSKTFYDEVAAAKCYDELAVKYHGEFARLNFPELVESETQL